MNLLQRCHRVAPGLFLIVLLPDIINHIRAEGGEWHRYHGPNQTEMCMKCSSSFVIVRQQQKWKANPHAKKKKKTFRLPSNLINKREYSLLGLFTSVFFLTHKKSAMAQIPWQQTQVWAGFCTNKQPSYSCWFSVKKKSLLLNPLIRLKMWMKT